MCLICLDYLIIVTVFVGVFHIQKKKRYGQTNTHTQRHTTNSLSLRIGTYLNVFMTNILHCCVSKPKYSS